MVKLKRIYFNCIIQVQITCLQILWNANISASTFKHSFNIWTKWQPVIGENNTTRENMNIVHSVICFSRSNRLIEMEICVSPILMRNEDLLLWTQGLESAPLNHPRSLVAEKKKQFESNHATHLMQFKRWATFLLYSSKYGSHSLFSRDQWNGAHQWHVVDQSVENILSSFPRVVQLAHVQTHLGGQLAKRSPGQSVVEFSVWRDSDWDNVSVRHTWCQFPGSLTAGSSGAELCWSNTRQMQLKAPLQAVNIFQVLR